MKSERMLFHSAVLYLVCQDLQRTHGVVHYTTVYDEAYPYGRLEESGELPADVADITRKSRTDYVVRKRFECRHWAMRSRVMGSTAEHDERCLWKLQSCFEWTE